MRKRADILSDLVRFEKDLKSLREELAQYPWDIEEPLVVMTQKDLVSVIQKGIKSGLTEMEDWANAIESREDIEFENEEVQEVIFELANPTLHGEITKERLSEFVKKFS